MKLHQIKILEKGRIRRIFIDDIEQKGVVAVEPYIDIGSPTEIRITYYVDKFEVIREE